MKIETFAGGWYCAARPGGDYAVLITGKHVETPDGPVALPPGGNALFLVLARDGRIAGIGHQDDQAWEADIGGSWHRRGVAFGPNALIYDQQDQLRIISGPPAVGFRQVSDAGQLITAEESYAWEAQRIWEFTTTGGVTIGQGGKGVHGEDPLIALYQGKRYLLAKGRCRRIVVHREGEELAIAWVQEDEGEARIMWLNVSEIATFPVDTGEPVPEPEPEPEEPMVLPMHVQYVVNALYGKHVDLAEGDDNQRRELTKMIAEQARFVAGERWGWKSAHATLESPSKDAIAYLIEASVRLKEPQRMFVFDLFDGTTRKPNQFPSGERVEQYFIPVEAINHLAEEPPDDEPDDRELLERITDLERRLDAMPTTVDLAEAVLVVILPALQALVNTAVDSLVITTDPNAEPLSTSRAWSHSHSLRLTIVRK